MGRPSHAKALGVWMNGLRVGIWRIPSRAPEEMVYDPAWVQSDLFRPLSLSLPAPAGGGALRGNVVAAYFDNLLPDNDTIRRRLQMRFRTGSLAPFDLLAAIGRDCVGAIQLLPENEAPGPIDRIDGEPLDEQGVARELIRAATMPGPHITHPAEDDELRISIAGAQEKTALLRHHDRWCRPRGTTPSTHIFKLPLGFVGNRQLDFATSVENEWLCLKLLDAFGLAAAPANIATFEDQKCLVVERFDRVLHSSRKYWLRLAQEDLCQATGTPGMRKYEKDRGPGILDLVALLRHSENPGDIERFLKTQVLFWMLRATDGHAKNFSITLKAGGRYCLTPAYDVLSVWPFVGTKKGQIPPQKVTLAMAWSGKTRHYHVDSIRVRHFIETARRCGFGDEMPGVLGALANQTKLAVESVAARLPDGFPAQIAESIFKGLLDTAEILAAGLDELKL